MVNHCINNILLRLFPDPCQLCGAPASTGLCTNCHDSLPRNHPSCLRCALPLSSEEHAICGHCLQSRPVIDQSTVPFLYTDPIDRLIGQFKFSGNLATGRLLSDLLSASLARQAERPERLIPIPLHRRRLSQRGYNQALELARPIARRFDIPLDYHSCVRSRDTQPQAELKKRQRKKNLLGAFRLIQEIPVRHVALIDDVLTTGSTVSELARLLKQSGVERVDVWAVARTP